MPSVRTALLILLAVVAVAAVWQLWKAPAGVSSHLGPPAIHWPVIHGRVEKYRTPLESVLEERRSGPDAAIDRAFGDPDSIYEAF